MKAFQLLVSSLVLFFLIQPASSQEITNIVSKQQGDQVAITYNLTAPANSNYYIKIYLLKEGNLSNGKELMYVSGDVKDTKPGNSKRIIWDAKKELGHYNGSAQFKIEAINRMAPMPQEQRKTYSKIELTGANNKYGQVRIDFIMTTIKEDDSYRIEKGKSFVVSSDGNMWNVNSYMLGNIMDNFKYFAVGVPVKCYIIIEGIDAAETTLPTVQLNLRGNNDTFGGNTDTFTFNNVPITE